MITLQTNQYEFIEPMFSDIPGALWHLASMVNRNLGTVIVDDFPNPNTVYLETPFLFYYFAGSYNKSFMEDIMNHIVKELIPVGESRPVFIFSSNQEWKDKIENYLRPHIHQEFGAYLTRRLYHLNVEKYNKIKESFVVPKDYILETENRNDGIYANAFHNGKEVSKCNDGGRGLGYMDFNVFTHPEHRNKGLALYCCSRLIDYCLHNNIIPQWGCFTVNIPSGKLAEKLGFEVTSETQVNYAKIKHNNTV